MACRGPPCNAPAPPPLHHPATLLRPQPTSANAVLLHQSNQLGFCQVVGGRGIALVKLHLYRRLGTDRGRGMCGFGGACLGEQMEQPASCMHRTQQYSRPAHTQAPSACTRCSVTHALPTRYGYCLATLQRRQRRVLHSRPRHDGLQWRKLESHSVKTHQGRRSRGTIKARSAS